MARGPIICIDYQGQKMTLNQFSDACGINYRTMNNRWQKGERSIEQLSRPVDPKQSRARPPKKRICINSLLAGWKCPTTLGVSEAVSTPSVSTAPQTA